MRKNLHNSKKNSNFAPAFRKIASRKRAFGRLDERLSQRSAKPFRAV